MNVRRQICLVCVGLVFGTIACGLVLRYVLPVPGSLPRQVALIDELAIRSRQLFKETREYPTLSVEQADASNSWTLSFMDRVECTDREQCLLFLVRHAQLLDRMPHAEGDRLVLLNVSSMVSYGTLSDILQDVGKTGFDYVWLAGDGVLRIRSVDAHPGKEWD